MSVCAFILCLCCPVYVTALRGADYSSKESYRLCKKDYETEEEALAHANVLLRENYIIVKISHIGRKR
jgi:hypothetical protein